MKAKTKTKNGYIFFVYEDYHGTRFRSWNDIAWGGDGVSYLVGYFHSYYWNGSEPIDELVLTGRPSIGEVKEFMQRCKDFINAD